MRLERKAPAAFTRVVNALLISLSLLAIAQYGYVALSRIAYPYELEWMEGATVDSFARVLRGDLLYNAPTVDYIPPIYGPAYFYLGAVFPLLLGTTPFALRLLSVFASVGIFALLYGWVRREGGGAAAALVASGLFAASFGALGYWFDLARVDTAYLFFLLLGCCCLRFGRGSRALVLSAVFLSIATFIKINAAVVILLLLPFVLLTFRRQALVWLGVLALVGGGVTALFTLISGEWFLYFVLARSQDAIAPPESWFVFWTDDLARLWVALALAVGAVVMFARRRQLAAFRFYIYFAAGMLIAAWVSRVHHGSWVNVNFSAYAVVILLAAVGLSRALERLQAAGQWRRWVGLGLITALVALQFGTLYHDPSAQIPTAADQAAGAAFVERLAQVEGETLLFAHGYYPQLAGIPAAESGWLMNMSHGERTGAKADFDASVRAAIASRRFAVIVTDNAFFLHEGYLNALEANYIAEVIPFDGAAFIPVTGAEVRPLHWWMPRP